MQCWKLVAFPLAALAIGCGEHAAHVGTEDGVVDTCIEELRAEARGVGPAGAQWKARILAEPGAVDALVPLLADPDDRVAGLAAFALRDAPRIAPTYLPQIRAGLDRGLRWLPPALGRIGTDEAAREAVDRYLVSDEAPENQEAYAVQLSGHRALPFIVERARCRPDCEANTHVLLAGVLARMGLERVEVGPALLRIAGDRDASPQAAQGALIMISQLGHEARALEADLVQLRESAPSLAHWIDIAEVGIGSRRSGSIFVERLASRPDVITLRDLAQTGEAGRDAGPAVIELMRTRPELRPAAAHVLGYIGYDDAVPVLVDALDDPADVRVAWASATSLGRLRAAMALPALERTAARHWYPPVREAAQRAVAALRHGAAAEEHRVGFFAFDGINEGLPECREPRGRIIRENTATKLHAATAREELARLRYPSEVVSYGAAGEHRERIEREPRVALRVDGGWLAGSSGGEFGGELVFIGDDGGFQKILDGDNVVDIHRLRDRIVAITGMAHLSANRGSLVAVTPATNGRWTSRIWRTLPGAPAASALLEPGELFVSIRGGGAVLVDAAGTMRMAECTQ
jgi:hypothetical protein